MENLDQIQLLYINFALLMFTASIALYLPKKIKNAQNPKPKIHPEIVNFYKMLNQSLKINQPKLTYIVDKMPTSEFISFYKGLKYLHGFNIDLQAHQLDNGVYSEYIVLDLASYTGPRTVEVAMHEEPPQRIQSAAQLYKEARLGPNFKAPQKSVGNIISLLSRHQKVAVQVNHENKVVDLNSYRQNRVIKHIPGNNEGA